MSWGASISRPPAPASGLVLLSSASIAAPVAAVDFALPGSYLQYVLLLANVSCGGAAIWLRDSVDNGATFGAAGYTYTVQRNVGGAASSAAAEGASAAAQIALCGTAAPATVDAGLGGEIRIWRPSHTAAAKRFSWHLGFRVAANTQDQATGVGRDANTAAAVTHIRLQLSAGNIAAGEMKLYGVRLA